MNGIIILHTNYGIIFKRYILLLFINNQIRIYNTISSAGSINEMFYDTHGYYTIWIILQI